MKLFLFIGIFFISVYSVTAQIGIGTTTPNSKLDVRGSLATSYRSFTSGTTATASDNVLIFSGTADDVVTLPTAVGCAGRNYLIKNAATGSPVPILTIATTSSQTIDGITNWVLEESNETVLVVSNGANWHVAALNLPALASGINWIQDGNSVSTLKSIGTISNYDLPFISNNTEKMRLTATGSFRIGTSAFNVLNPEKLLVDAGTTTSYNVINGKGSINNYFQLNIQNRFAGNVASSDVVASANNGSETANFIDMGVNSSAYSNPAYPILDGINNTYLYSAGRDFTIGNATANKNLSFFTGGYDLANEYVRITGAGLTGIGNTGPTEQLQVEGNIRLSGLNKAIFFDANLDPYSGIKNISRAGEVNELMLFAGKDPAGSIGPDRIRLASNEIYFATAAASGGINNGDPSSFYQDTTLVPTRMFINQNGKVAIGATSFNTASPEQLLVNAGNTASYNVISGKGSYNNYLQLNIQNNSGGAAASSDIVATADNGNETTKFVDLGINSDGYTGTGITGGVNNAYLFTTGNDFIIGNATDSKTLIFYTSTGGTSTKRMSITNAGLIPAQNNVYSLGNSSTRNTAIWAVNGVIQTSDKRLKRNIHSLGYGLKEVLQMQPVAYNWTDEKFPQNKIGLIAQDVKKLIPEIVSGNEQKEYLGINYAEMVPVLINSIKELKNKVEALKKKAKELNLIN